MANETNEISDVVKKCKILLLDIEGTTTSISFVKDKLFPYAEENVQEFLDTQWENEDVKEAVTALRKLAIEDQEKSVEGVVTIPGEDASKEDQIKGLVENVKWQMSQDRKVGALKQLQGLIWKRGYDKGEIKGHVYEDVSPALQLWRSVDGQKVYIYSSGSVQAQKLLFSQSLAGDMLPLIDGHFDTAVGAKQEAASYVSIAEKIVCKPEEILFLTDIVKEAEAARSSGLQVALVSREGNAPLPAEATAAYPVLHSFAQLANTNKRKPPSQDEQPAKVPKTDTEDNVKTASESVTNSEALKKPEEPEKMDVEEPASDNVDQNEVTEAVLTETTVEEVTDAKAIDAPALEAEPIVIEKTDEMETETAEVIDSVTLLEDKSKSEDTKKEDKAPVAEETPPTVITEIEELPDDKHTLSEMAEIIEDLEPIVEEPPVIEEMDDLQNVGEVLEKECDEILSKVQDVTNLDNIPVKPLLNTIVEETMETENTDSSDIVDRILDTEMELAMKPCEEVEVNKAEKIADVKTQTVEEESSNKEENIAKKVPDDPTSCGIEQPKVIDNNINPKETAEKDVQVDVQELNLKSLEKKMESEESKEQPNEKHIQEKLEETVGNVENTESKNIEEQNKIETEVSKTMVIEKPEESKITTEVQSTANVETKTEVVENKKELVENKTEVLDNKSEVEVENNKEVVENKTKVEVVENKTEVVDNKTEVVENKTDTEVVGNKMEVVENKTEVVENKMGIVENKIEVVENKMEIVENKTEAVKSGTHVTESKTDGENITDVIESKEETKENIMEVEEKVLDTKDETEMPPIESQKHKESSVMEESTEAKEIVSATEEVKAEYVVTATQLNGKETNGDSETANLNGDVSQAEELSSRLSVENGKEEVNGSNGDSNDEQGQGDNKMETEIADIKVKSVTTDEPRPDPIDQPTEA